MSSAPDEESPSEIARSPHDSPWSLHMPRVSIGMPIYNAERYLAAALDSLLAQTYDDFELVICDNASTDSTQAICEQYAARDTRIHYHRNAANVGAAANFNRCFELATGEFFKWSAHDDLCEPTFLKQCVDILDAEPGCVLAYPRARIIDADGQTLEDYDHKLPTDSQSPFVRFSSLLRGHRCFEIFGLIRRDALASTPVMGNYSHGDGVLLGRLALLGTFREVPEYLFLARQHAEQSMQMIGDHESFAEWFDPANKGKTLFPNWRIFWEFSVSIHRVRIPLAQRVRCYAAIARQAWTRKLRLAGDITENARGLLRGRARPAPVPAPGSSANRDHSAQ
jgi:glycosyltransferase involved in cell wall biosynthesis